MDPLRIGLEIHIQLNTGKLFCPCACDINDTELGTFRRTLYPTSGELGKTDRAALFELSRGLAFEYKISENSCLVEMDEEPPHEINSSAVKAAVAMSVALNCRIFPEVFVMRKIVIDGSNTTGFQRTSLVGIDGNAKIHDENIGILSVCLEEDSARKLSQDGGNVHYSLDRLGIPLVEIATGPDMKSPEEAMEVAREIGYMAASTGMVRRGAESIRQDVNMSLGFGRVEIKGVSRLSLIRDVILNEKERQLNLAEAVSALKKRGPDKAGTPSTQDVTEMFRKTESRIISSALKRRERIIAVKLDKLHGLLKNGKYRFGREIADSLRPFGIKGVLHGDELPDYGISEDIVEGVKKTLGTGKEDSFALVAAPRGRKDDIAGTIAARIEKIISLDFSETRSANADGTTSFLRPLPGRERMYPETDIPTFRISGEFLQDIQSIVPMSFEEQVRDLSGKYGISKQDASTMIRNGDREFLVEFSSKADPKFAARILIHLLPQLEKELSLSIDREVVSTLLDQLSGIGRAKLSLETALRLLYLEKMSVEEILKDRRIEPLSADEISHMISGLLVEDDNLTVKTIIAVMKKKSDRPFDPVLAVKVFNETQNV